MTLRAVPRDRSMGREEWRAVSRLVRIANRQLTETLSKQMTELWLTGTPAGAGCRYGLRAKQKEPTDG